MSLRVLMIAPTPFFGDRGCHIHIYEQIRALIRLGIQVRLCTYPLGRDLEGLDRVRTWRPPGIHREKIGPARERYLLDALLFLTCLHEANAFRPDIIHAHLHEGTLIGCAVRCFTGIPVLFDLQGSLTGEMQAHGYLRPGTMKEGWFRWLERVLDQGADFLVATSSASRDEAIRSFGVPPERAALLLDGVDCGDFRPGLECADLRARYDLSATKPVVVYLGLLTHYQGTDCLIESIPLVLDQAPETVFLIMGYPDEQRYAQLARSRGIPDRNIRFSGRVAYHEAPRHLCLGEIAVSPKLGLTEANGKLYNYMACGLPTVAFDNPMNREILDDTGLYAETGSSSSLAGQMLRLLKNPGLARNLGTGARKRAVEHFGWQGVATRLVRFYERIIAERR